MNVFNDIRDFFKKFRGIVMLFKFSKGTDFRIKMIKVILPYGYTDSLDSFLNFKK
jgi:hypothetical protein